MAVFSGPEIVNDGLVLHLDAANDRSYPGSGTTWSDLSGNGNNGTLINGVGYSTDNNGVLTFDGVDDYALAPSDVYNFGTNDFTMSVWIKSTSFDSLQRIFSQALDGQINCLFAVRTTGVLLLRIIDAVAGTDFLLENTEVSLTLNEWYNCLVKRNGNTWSLYINGELVISDTSSVAYPYRSNVPFAISISQISNGNHVTGNISNVMIYNGKGLTELEIKQNYNAMRSRYGI